MARTPGQRSTSRIRGETVEGLRRRELMSRAPSGQAMPLLPPLPEAQRRAALAGLCPWCGRGPWRVLAIHTSKAHGVSRRELSDLIGVTYSTSICDPAYSQRCAERASTPPARIDGQSSKPRVLSEAAKELNRQKLATARSPEQLRRATEMAHTAEAQRKRSDSVRRAHAEGRMRPKRPCPRCGAPRRSYSNARYCGPDCAKASQRENIRRAMKADWHGQ